MNKQRMIFGKRAGGRAVDLAVYLQELSAHRAKRDEPAGDEIQEYLMKLPSEKMPAAFLEPVVRALHNGDDGFFDAMADLVRWWKRGGSADDLLGVVLEVCREDGVTDRDEIFKRVSRLGAQPAEKKYLWKRCRAMGIELDARHPGRPKRK